MIKFTHKVVLRNSAWGQVQADFKAQGAYVKAGVFGGSRRMGGNKRAGSGSLTNAQAALLAEYGTSRAPARPWISPVFIRNRKKYAARIAAAVKRARKNKKGIMTEVRRELAKVGVVMVTDIRNYVLKTPLPGVLPPNAPSTIARKGSNRTLVDTHQMVDSVSYKIVSKKAPR